MGAMPYEPTMLKSMPVKKGKAHRPMQKTDGMTTDDASTKMEALSKKSMAKDGAPSAPTYQ